MISRSGACTAIRALPLTRRSILCAYQESLRPLPDLQGSTASRIDKAPASEPICLYGWKIEIRTFPFLYCSLEVNNSPEHMNFEPKRVNHLQYGSCYSRSLAIGSVKSCFTRGLSHASESVVLCKSLPETSELGWWVIRNAGTLNR